MKKISITTLGCKVNQFESASFFSRLAESGNQVVENGSNCDVVILNTCAVTAKAGRQSRQLIRRTLRLNPQAYVIITGCYTHVEAEEISHMEELSEHQFSVISNADKELLVDHVLGGDYHSPISYRPFEDTAQISRLPVTRFGERTRSYLRIQDGCNSFCTYCIVPHTRGRSRSLPEKEVLEQAKVFAEEGYKEIVITGIHVGYYGQDLAEDINIARILDSLCRETPGIRYRLSSIEPLEVTEELFEVMTKNNNFMPHLHIPLQSASDDILWRMNRRYTTAQFADVVKNCGERIRDIALGIDILAGFPGETDKHFSEALTFLEKLAFTYLHVFPYSKRPSTPAAEYSGQVARDIKDERVRRLRQLGANKKTRFYRRFLGTTRPVLVEGKIDDAGRLHGFTDNYIPVYFQGSQRLKNSVVDVKITQVNDTEVTGEIVSRRP